MSNIVRDLTPSITTVAGGGTGASTPQGAAQNLATAFFVATLTDAKALTARPPLVFIGGRAVAGDGFEGFFQWHAGAVATADDVLTINPTSGTSGLYVRIFQGVIQLKWWCTGDGVTDDTAGMTAVNTYWLDNDVLLNITAGQYRYNSAPNWAKTHGRVRCEGDVRFVYFGSGNAFVIDAGDPGVCYDLDIGGGGVLRVDSEGNQVAANLGANGLFARSVINSNIAVTVDGCGAGSAGLLGHYCQNTTFDQFKVSNNEHKYVCTSASGSPILTAVTDPNGISGTTGTRVGMYVIGTGIPAGAKVQSFTATTITMDANASASTPGLYVAVWFRPSYGIFLTRRPILMEASTANYFPKVTIEGVLNTGIYLEYAVGNIFEAGVSENNGGNGVYLAAGAVQNEFNGLDTEANASGDMNVLGHTNQFYGIQSDSIIAFTGSASGNQGFGGAGKSVTFGASTKSNDLTQFLRNRSNNGGVVSDLGLYNSVSGPDGGSADLLPGNPPERTVITVTSFPDTYTNQSGNEQRLFITPAGSVPTLELVRGGVGDVVAYTQGEYSLLPGDSLILAGAPSGDVIVLVIE